MTSSEMEIAQWTLEWAQGCGLQAQYSKATESTNDQAKSEEMTASFDSANPSIFVTEHQTKGRGRGSNNWVDNKPGKYLLSSWMFSLNNPPQQFTAPLVGLALYTACKEAWPDLKFSLKAPNDLYIAEKKIGGLLVENIQKGKNDHIIIGLGMNVGAHPEEIAESSHLSFYTDESMSNGEWLRFLDSLFANLENAVKHATQTEMSAQDCQHLLAALNTNPLADPIFDEVRSNGDLICGGKTIPWQSL